MKWTVNAMTAALGGGGGRLLLVLLGMVALSPCHANLETFDNLADFQTTAMNLGISLDGFEDFEGPWTDDLNVEFDDFVLGNRGGGEGLITRVNLGGETTANLINIDGLSGIAVFAVDDVQINAFGVSFLGDADIFIDGSDTPVDSVNYNPASFWGVIETELSSAFTAIKFVNDIVGANFQWDNVRLGVFSDEPPVEPPSEPPMTVEKCYVDFVDDYDHPSHIVNDVDYLNGGREYVDGDLCSYRGKHVDYLYDRGDGDVVASAGGANTGISVCCQVKDPVASASFQPTTPSTECVPCEDCENYQFVNDGCCAWYFWENHHYYGTIDGGGDGRQLSGIFQGGCIDTYHDSAEDYKCCKCDDWYKCTSEDNCETACGLRPV